MVPMQGFIDMLHLEVLVDAGQETLNVDTSDINRPGLQMAGFYDYFASDRLQVIGRAEMEYMKNLSSDLLFARLDTYFASNIPAVVVCRNMPCPAPMLEAAKKHGVTLLRSRLVTTRFSMQTALYLSQQLAPTITRHGVLVDVMGIGVMLTGESGIGKSESALELVKRGHRLVADDVVNIRRVTDGRLVGEAPNALKHFMEIRGVGIIDVRNMYGVGAVINSKSINLVIHLETWEDHKDYDRLGLSEQEITLLGVRVPRLLVPVRPGRIMAIVIEVAASNHRLKALGYNAAQTLTERLAGGDGESDSSFIHEELFY